MTVSQHLNSMTLLGVVAAVLFSAAGFAQNAGPQEAWVDPLRGNDNIGALNRQDKPYQTIRAAQLALAAAAPPPSPANPGTVHCNPGIYGPTAFGGENNEPLPVGMFENINIQGVGAKRCIIRGGQSTIGPLRPFIPYSDNSTNTRPFLEILVDFSFLVDLAYAEMFDGMTLQGGHIQVYMETESHDIYGRISNCIFDMLHEAPDVWVPGPWFGILMVHTWDNDLNEAARRSNLPEHLLDTVIQDNYWDIFLGVFNNTFVQGWRMGDGEFAVSLPENVAICDVANTLANDPLFPAPPAIPDGNATYRGVGNSNIQNNLIRYLPETFAPTALLGIDLSDVTATASTSPGLTNAFDPNAVGGANMLFTSLPIGPAPLPKIHPIPGAPNPNNIPQADPAFIGEYLAAPLATGGLALGNAVSRDWRILPSSILVDQGTTPLLGEISAANGATHFEGPDLVDWCFDYDSENFGNIRTQGLETDIGCDETDMFVVARYANDTRSIGSNLIFLPEAHTFILPPDDRVLIFPYSGNFDIYEHRAGLPYAAPFPPGGTYWAWSTQFGSLQAPVGPYLSTVPGYQNSWLFIDVVHNPPWSIFNRGQSAPIQASVPVNGVFYTPVGDMMVHSFGITLDSPSNPIYPTSMVSEQVIFRAEPGGEGISNMQWSYED